MKKVKNFISPKTKKTSYKILYNENILRIININLEEYKYENTLFSKIS